MFLSSELLSAVCGGSVRRRVFALLLIAGSTSGVAYAQISFDDVSESSGVAQSASETWGAAWGDVNGDAYPDVYTSNHRTRATLFRNNRDGTFSDVSAEVDLSAVPGWTGGRANVDQHGAVWGDIDNDGDDDLYLSVSSDHDFLLINDNGLLTDRSASWQVTQFGHDAARMPLFLDYTGDGKLDIAAIALTRPRLYPQLSNSTFGYALGQRYTLDCADDGSFANLADVESTPGLELLCGPRNGVYPENVYAFSAGVISDVTNAVAQTSRVNDAVSFDFNGDLRPDLFELIATSRPSDVYQADDYHLETQLITSGGTNKNVRFRTTGNVTFKASLREGSDPEGDPRYIDIGASGWSPSSLLFTLSPQDTSTWGIKTDSLGINIGYDNVLGEWQIYQSGADYRYAYLQIESDQVISNVAFNGATKADTGYIPRLLLNSPGGFSNATASAQLDAFIRCVSVAAGDFDNDMDEDLYLACTGGAHNVANIIYENLGNGTFQEVPGAGGAAGFVGAAVGENAGTSETVVLADFDIDGFLDVFVTNGNNMRPLNLGGPKQLFRNLGNANNWVELDLEGVTSNRDGTGSIVLVTAGGVTQYREQNGGYHRWAQNFRRIHVGLGPNTSADITVQWPDGTSDTYEDVAANALYRATQGGELKLVLDTDGDGVSSYLEQQQGTDPEDPLDYLDSDRDGVPDAVELEDGTDPQNFGSVRDTDSGGIPDYIETVLAPNSGAGTFNPAASGDDASMDTDGDGLADVHEAVLGTDPDLQDSDEGGVSDRDELVNGSNPLNGADDENSGQDSDGDGLSDGEEVQIGTDPAKADTDGDGLSDGEEVNIYGTSPLKKNTDADGLNDNVEIWWKGTDPLNPDTDGDGLTDGEEASQSGLGTSALLADTDGGGDNDGDEVANGTDPLDPSDDVAGTIDTDNDGLSNAQEGLLGTNPLVADTDGGGVDDGDEVSNGTNPLDAADDNQAPTDTDGDGLSDTQEVLLGTDPAKVDTDGDKLGDGDEVNVHGTDPLQRNTDNDGLNDNVEIWWKGTDPLNPDTDGDGLTDGEEASQSGLGTNPLDPDTDRGGDPDGVEVANGTDPLDPSDDVAGTLDTDGDGLSNAQEGLLGTDPAKPDTDGGGVNDGTEVSNGTNPLDGSDDNQAPTDTDGDGLSDTQEVLLGTDPAKVDTDGDQLGDGDEVNVYGTSPLDRNTDKDGLNDNVEIWWKGTDPLNPDTDGDGLTDGQEASQSGLGTNPLLADTDGGGVSDGAEVANGTDPLDPADD